MAQERIAAKNTFEQGLVMDFAPERVGDQVLTNALNATFLTFNGNEWSLQNDMGNARVETAFLPTGYIPVGTCEFGDIIYIVSYNPIENKSQIGCFPSPERNISNKELGNLQQSVSSGDFTNGNGQLLAENVRKIVYNGSNINPGDKFIISWDKIGITNFEKVSNYGNMHETFDKVEYYWPKLVQVHVVSIEDTGKITYLDSTVKWYTDGTTKDSKYNKDNSKEKPKFILTTENLSEEGTTTNLDTYRSALSCQYSVFQSKIPGKLALYFQLETINNFSCGHKTIKRPDTADSNNYIYDVYLSASWETDNYNINPCGMLITDITYEGRGVTPLDTEKFPSNDTGEVIYDAKKVIEFNRVYKMEAPGDSYQDFLISTSYYTGTEGVQAYQYPFENQTSIIATSAVRVYEKDENNTKRPKENKGLGTYAINPKKYEYDEKTKKYVYKTINASGEYVILDKDLPDDIVVNYFKKSVLKKMGSFKVSKEIETTNSKDTDYTVDYTVCPCMPYGVLDSLAVSNTIYFNRAETGEVKLNTWQYYVNSLSMTLKFGFDTYLKESEGEVIDKVIMEFYDNLGICASYELTGQEAYNSVFTEYLELDKAATNSRMRTSKLAENSRDVWEPIFHKGSMEQDLKLSGLIAGNYNLSSYFIEISDKNGKSNKKLCSDLDASEKNTYASNSVYLLDSGILYYGRPYGVRIKIFKGTETELGAVDPSGYENPIIIDRWLWTAPLFNDYYGNVSDFKTCQAELYLDFKAELDGSDIKLEESELPHTNFTAAPESTFKIYRQYIASKAKIANKKPATAGATVKLQGYSTLRDYFGDSLFLDRDAYPKITVQIALGNSSIAFDSEEFTTEYAETDYGTIPELNPIYNNGWDEGAWKWPSTTEEQANLKTDQAAYKDQFNLSLDNVGTEVANFSYINESGETVTVSKVPYQKVTGDVWAGDKWSKDSDSSKVTFTLNGVKFTKAQAQDTQQVNIAHILRKFISTRQELNDQLKIDLTGLGSSSGVEYSQETELSGFIFFHQYLVFLGVSSAGDHPLVERGRVLCNSPYSYSRISDYTQEGSGPDGIFGGGDGNAGGDDGYLDFEKEEHKYILNGIRNDAPIIPVILETGWTCHSGGDEGTDNFNCSHKVTGITSQLNAQDPPLDYTNQPYKIADYKNYIKANIGSSAWQTAPLDGHLDTACFISNFSTGNIPVMLAIYDSALGTYVVGPDLRIYQHQARGQIRDSLIFGTRYVSSIKQYFPWKEPEGNIETGQKKAQIYNYAVLLASIFLNVYVEKPLDGDPQCYYIGKNVATCKEYEEYWNSDIIVHQQMTTFIETSKMDPTSSTSNALMILPTKTYSDGTNSYRGIKLFWYAAAILKQMYPKNTILSKALVDWKTGPLNLNAKTDAGTEILEVLDFTNINPRFQDTTRAIAFKYSIPFAGKAVRDLYSTSTENTLVRTSEGDFQVTGYKDETKFYTFNSDVNTISVVNSNTKFKLIQQVSVKNNVITITGSGDYVPLHNTVNIWDHIYNNGGNLTFKNLDQLSDYKSNVYSIWNALDKGDDAPIHNLRGIYLFDFARAW